jgi:hypothetical protein
MRRCLDTGKAAAGQHVDPRSGAGASVEEDVGGGEVPSAGSEIAEAEKVDRSYVNPVLRLTLLAPEIQEAILDGRQPKALQPGCSQARGRSSGNAFSGDSRRVAGCPKRRESDIGENSRLGSSFTDQGNRPFDGLSRTDDIACVLPQDAFEFHGHQHLVLDDEHAPAVQRPAGVAVRHSLRPLFGC